MKRKAAPRPPRLRARAQPRWLSRLLACALITVIPSLPAQDQDHVPAPGQDPLRDYLEAIAQAESRGGAYAPELVDLYHGMGQSLLERGDLEEARDAFHQTVMVARVNSGPNSLEQTNYLYSIAEIESRLGNPEAAVRVLETIYLIHARYHGEDDPAMLPVVEKLYAWYIERQSLSAVPLRPSDYQNLSYLAGRIASLTERQSGLGHTQTALSYRALGQIHFRAILNLIETGESLRPELLMNSNAAGNVLLFQRSVINHFEAGEEAFDRAVLAWQENPEGTELELAEAIAQLGDWYLALKSFRKAERQYQRAYQVLADSADFAFLAEKYLGTPSPLRFLNTTGGFVRDLEAPATKDNLEISMTVTRSGRLYDIVIVNAPPDQSDDQLGEIRKILEATRFRPAVVNGKLQKVEGFVWKPLVQAPKEAPRNA